MKKMVISAACLISAALFAKPDLIHVIEVLYYTPQSTTPVSFDEWEARGKNGTVSRHYSNGVYITHSFVRGRLQGAVTHTYPYTSTSRLTEEFDNNHIVKSSLYYPSGALAEERAGLGSGAETHRQWYENGSKQSEEVYESGYLTQGSYFYQGKQESEVLAGAGTRVVRDGSGSLLHKEEVSQGAVAALTYFYPNGDIQSYVPQKNGRVEGVVKHFLAGGQPLSVEEWADGERCGKTLCFTNGALTSEISYVAGHKTGVERRFADQDRVIQEISWELDKHHGPTTTYINGKPYTEWYHRDKKVNQMTFEILNLPALH